MIAPYDCKHTHTAFVQSGSCTSDGQAFREHVSVCRDCGLFRIVGHANGEHFRVEFALCMDEQIDAASQHIKWLALPDDDLNDNPDGDWNGHYIAEYDDPDLPLDVPPGAVAIVAGAGGPLFDDD